MLKRAVGAIVFSILTPTLAGAADAVRVTVFPKTPLIETARAGQAINFDFVLENSTGEKLEIRSIEVDVLTSDGKLITQRRVQPNGASVTTVPERFLEPKKKISVFNPFHTFENDIDLSNLRYTFEFDDKETPSKYRTVVSVHPATYRGKTDLILPIQGRTFIHDGHDFYSHHRRLDLTGGMTTALGIEANFTRFAYDFLLVDERGKMHKGEGARNEDHYGFGTPLVAPGSGIVVRAVGDQDDRTKLNPFRPSMEAVLKDLYLIAGNYVLIDHRNGEYSLLAHLKKGSVTVKKGDRVKQGQKIGEMGASGDALWPHLHYQLQSDTYLGEGLPSYFRDFRRFVGSKWITVKKGTVDTGDIVESLNE